MQVASDESARTRRRLAHLEHLAALFWERSLLNGTPIKQLCAHREHCLPAPICRRQRTLPAPLRFRVYLTAPDSTSAEPPDSYLAAPVQYVTVTIMTCRAGCGQERESGSQARVPGLRAGCGPTPWYWCRHVTRKRSDRHLYFGVDPPSGKVEDAQYRPAVDHCPVTDALCAVVSVSPSRGAPTVLSSL